MIPEVDTGPEELGKGFSMTLAAFTKGFIAELVARDRLLIRPNEAADKAGFGRVVDALDRRVDSLVEAGDMRSAGDLVEIANRLRPSNTGAYEGFESALRAQQLTFARCPNPDYDDIEFPIPKDFALTEVEALASPDRKIVRIAVSSFFGEISAPP